MAETRALYFLPSMSVFVPSKYLYKKYHYKEEYTLEFLKVHIPLGMTGAW